MATLKFVAYFAILMICILHARSEKVNVVKDATVTPKEAPVEPATQATTEIDPATEDLVRMCANREIKRCNDRKCNQMICPKNTNAEVIFSNFRFNHVIVFTKLRLLNLLLSDSASNLN